MVLNGNGAFSCYWNNINNVLFRTGKKFGKSNDKFWKDYDNITLSYICDSYKPIGNSYLSVYGWTTNPLVEYYIVDNWGSWRPSGKNISKGTIDIDGGIYDIYETTLIDKPSINGTQTFQQYWSIRTTKRSINNLNIVSVHEHFKDWESKGMNMSGNIYEVSMVVEGYQSNGEANLSSVVVTL